VEAARALAQRALTNDAVKNDDERISWTWRAATGRQAKSEEIALLKSLLEKHRMYFNEKPKAAKSLVSVGMSPGNEQLKIEELAAWTSASRALLNLNETISRN
jgi:hypothetical protein